MSKPVSQMTNEELAAALMRIEDFEVKRPRLAKRLLEMVEREDIESILPCDDDHCLYSAMVCMPMDVHGLGRVYKDTILVCVSATHPNAQLEEYAPGEPTWVWENDL